MIMRMLFTIFVFSCLVLPVPALCQDNGQDNEEKAAGGITLRDCIENLTLEGDLLIRYERRELDVPDGDDKNLDRIRTRFRLGFVWKSLDESWEVGAGLAPGGPEATRTQDTWSEEEFFGTGDIRLDYAYASHSLGDLTFVVGQQKNPFETSWLLWDSDVRPAGSLRGKERIVNRRTVVSAALAVLCLGVFATSTYAIDLSYPVAFDDRIGPVYYQNTSLFAPATFAPATRRLSARGGTRTGSAPALSRRARSSRDGRRSGSSSAASACWGPIFPDSTRRSRCSSRGASSGSGWG